MPMSSRWLPLVALLISSMLWLAVSSVMANSVHLLAKANFTWRAFGSVSVWLVALNLAWLVFVSYALMTNTQLCGKSVIWELFAVAVWVVTLLALAAFGDAWIGSLGVLAVVVWVIEIGVAYLFISQINQQSLPFSGLLSGAWLLVMTLTWLSAIKALFLCLSPGVALRL